MDGQSINSNLLIAICASAEYYAVVFVIYFFIAIDHATLDNDLNLLFTNYCRIVSFNKFK